MYIFDDYEKSFIFMDELVQEVDLKDFTETCCLNSISGFDVTEND